MALRHLFTITTTGSKERVSCFRKQAAREIYAYENAFRRHGVPTKLKSAPFCHMGVWWSMINYQRRRWDEAAWVALRRMGLWLSCIFEAGRCIRRNIQTRCCA